MTEKRKQFQCSCGSKLRGLEIDSERKIWVICLGANCNKRWLSKRQIDKDLPAITEIKKDWRGV